jgi:glycogen debranching enzyme
MRATVEGMATTDLPIRLHPGGLRAEIERNAYTPSPPGRLERPVRSGANVDIRHPRTFVLHEGYSVVETRPDGSMGDGLEEGLFDFDTRLLSWWRLRLDGRDPEFVSNGAVDSRRWTATLRHLIPGDDPFAPRLPQDAVEVHLHRRVSRGMEERVVLRNASMAANEVGIELELGADFADTQEASQGERRHVGRVTVAWNPIDARLTFEYDASHDGHRLHRALRVRLEGIDRELEMEPVRPRGGEAPPPWTGEETVVLRTSIALDPGEQRELRLRYESLVDGGWRSPLPEVDGPEGRPMTDRDREHEEWRAGRTWLESDDPVAGPAFDRAAEDLFDLRNWDLEGDSRDSWIPNAGVPIYSGVFGRDMLIAGWQSLLLGPEPTQGALRWCAATQGRRHNDWTEEDPGRMIHEIRRGPLSELRIIPQHGFYAAHTTSTLFPLVLAEHWHWTGRDAVLRQYLEPAVRALDWAAEHGDRDGDGFLEYVSRSEEGLKNEAWKDSTEAIRYPDGRHVENPVATVEEQAFHIAALARMAEILLAVGDRERAGTFLERARRLRDQWHEAFWMPGEGYYATALDPDKRPVASVTSNAGHALVMGVVPPVHARQVADRLLASDMFGGWGVRTLSSRHPSYNPLGYHLGTVWPFENALFLHGFRRYGLDDHADRLFTALLMAAGHFEALRLPELFGGHGRAEVIAPVAYPDMNIPQAWTASGIVLLFQSMLGFVPLAPARTLALVRPRLPAWLPAVTVRNLRVGEAVVGIRFTRTEDGTVAHEVVEQEGDLRIIRSDTTVPPEEGEHGSEGGIWTGDGWAERTSPETALALAVGLAGPSVPQTTIDAAARG